MTKIEFMIGKKLLNISYGVIFTFLFALLAFYLSRFSWAQSASLSPLIIAIVLGLLWANCFPRNLPKFLDEGIVFSQKKLLKLGIILYGFRLTFGDISHAGIKALLIDLTVVATILLLGLILGVKFFRLSLPLSILIASGSAICGAAAVLAIEEIVKAKKYEVTVAVATVVLFGSLSLFVSPFLLRCLSADPDACALALGATVHEVAQVLGSSAFFSQEVSSLALVVKLTRVLMLLPVLILLAIFCKKSSPSVKAKRTHWNKIPYFACLFFLVALLNSFIVFPPAFLAFTRQVDSFLLCMAMSALGVQTSLKKLKQVGIQPFLLATVLSGVLYLFLIAIALY